ncbi:protein DETOXIFICATION 18-like [Lycium ferocissimum]|uniref:protein DETOXIFICATION 18-like n=1 Tax=Lycium ferocissimum TaxID=112874 RepID=UPI002814B8B4|nr:protein DETOXIFICATION 18-like [Lycium ferocissimum]
MAKSPSHQLPLALSSEKWTNRWWNKLLVLACNGYFHEHTKQIMILWPMIVLSSNFLFTNLVSIMFAGHLGKLELAASSLANSWATVTGFSFMFGLSGALETLCSQAYEARRYTMLAIHLQTSCIISFFSSTVIAVIWWYSDSILINFFHQDRDIAKEAGVFLKFLIPGLFAYGVLQNVLRFLRAQSILESIVGLPWASFVIHICIIPYALVHWIGLGFKGASLATSISIWISLLMMGLYVFFSNRCNHIVWDGFSFEPFHHILTYLKLALPSAAIVCLEYCAFEILVLLAGLMPNPETTTSIIAMSVNTQAIVHFIFSGACVATSTRVANELGAGNPDRVKHVVSVTLVKSIIVGLAIWLTLFYYHIAWAGLFSDRAEIINKFASMTPLLLISNIFDISQGILSGVARGLGWQRCAMCINLGTLYFIGMPIACLIAFKFNLQTQGLWIGLICALGCQASGSLLLTLLTRWKKVEGSTNSNRETELLA